MEQKLDSRELRQKAKESLASYGGLSTVSKILAKELKLPNLKYFGSEKDEDIERREDWLEGEEFANSKAETRSKLAMLVELLEGNEDVAEAAAVQKQKVAELKSKNLEKILDKSRDLEKAWRELELFYTNAAEAEVTRLTIVNTDLSKIDESIFVNAIGERLDAVNKNAIDQSKGYTFLVAPGYIGQSLIEKLADVAYRNKILFLTDYMDRGSVEEVVEESNNPDRPKLGGNGKEWSRTVVFTNYALLRDKYDQEKRMLYGSVAAPVAGKLYSIDNIAQPIAGAQHGPLKGLKGIRFNVSQEQANVLDKENLNPLTNAFGEMMPFNCITLFKGDNVELRQYNVIRTLDYVDRVLKHFLNQYVFSSLLESKNREHVHRTIKNMLDRLVALKILKSGRITHFDISSESVERFDIKLEVIPMFVARAIDYTIGIDEKGLVPGESNI
ncbi:MAG: hypothetical protein KDC57_17035 [Saprospiraceae bacterium]|nr:hypothetical protein [Saprospiraceae bacterium]